MGNGEAPEYRDGMSFGELEEVMLQRIVAGKAITADVPCAEGIIARVFSNGDIDVMEDPARPKISFSWQ